MLMRGKMFRWMLIAGVCFGGMGVGAVRAAEPKDALKLVPEDAWGFVMLRSIGTVDERATYLQQLLNLPIPGQVTPMAMMMLQIMPNEENPIDMSSPVCVVMMDVQKFGAAEGAPMPDPSNAAVALIPAKNAEGLLKKFAAEEAKDGISKCTIANEPVYAAVKDKFVILGKNQDCVTRVLKSSKGQDGSVAAARVKVLSDSDIYVSVSVGSVMGAYREMISSFMQGMGQTMGQNTADLKKLQEMMEQMNSFDFSINISKEGLALKYLMDAKKGSDLEKLMLDSKNAEGPLLAQLPKEKYLIAGGAKGGYSEHAGKFGDPNIVGNMLRQLQAEGIDEKAVKTIDAEFLKIIKNMGQTAFCVSALPEGGEGGMFGLTLVIETKDADGFVASVRTIWENAWKLSTDEEAVKAKEFFVHKADAESIGDAKVDTVTLKVKELADAEEMDEDDMKTFETVMGKDVIFRFGAADSKHVVMTFGGGKARHESACKAMKAGNGSSLTTDKGIAAVSPNLPSPRSAEIFIAVDNIMQVVKSVAKIAGEEEEIPFEVPTLDAPIAISMVQDSGVQRGDFFVPTKLIVAIKKMIEDQMKADQMEGFDEEEGGDSEEGAEKTDGEEADDSKDSTDEE